MKIFAHPRDQNGISQTVLRRSWLGWSRARWIANSKLPQASSAIPAIGYALIWSDTFTEWLKTHETLGVSIIPPWSVEGKLLCLWWGAIFMTAGMIIFAVWCPKEIRRSAEPDDYLLEQFQLRNLAHLNEIAKRCIEQLIYSTSQDSKNQLASFHPGEVRKFIWGDVSPYDLNSAVAALIHHPNPFDTRGATDTTNILRSNFAILDSSEPPPRIASVALLYGGAALFLWPALNVVLQVFRNTLTW